MHWTGVVYDPIKYIKPHPDQCEHTVRSFDGCVTLPARPMKLSRGRIWEHAERTDEWRFKDERIIPGICSGLASIVSILTVCTCRFRSPSRVDESLVLVAMKQIKVKAGEDSTYCTGMSYGQCECNTEAAHTWKH